MVKAYGTGYSDSSLKMNINQYLIFGRRKVADEKEESKVYSMRIFAKNEVVARSRFWYQMRKLNKLKRANGEILSVHIINEKNTRYVKTYGIVSRMQSRTGYHNMYKEFRDVSLNGAISQLYQEMSGNHRVDPQAIHIIRTAVLNKAADVKRTKSHQFRNAKIKFPVVKTLPRASSKSFRSTFKATRPNTYRS